MSIFRTSRLSFSALLTKYFEWVLCTTCGFGFALPGVLFVTMMLYAFIGRMIYTSSASGMEDILFAIAPAITFGLIITAPQGVFLGFRKIRLCLWLLSSILAWLVFLAIYTYPPTAIESLSLWAGVSLAAIGLGLLIGLAQWLIMRKENNRSGWWILANVLGSIGGFAATSPILLTLPSSQDESVGLIMFLLIPLFGLVSSIISGIFLLAPLQWFDSQKAV